MPHYVFRDGTPDLYIPDCNIGDIVNPNNLYITVPAGTPDLMEWGAAVTGNQAGDKTIMLDNGNRIRVSVTNYSNGGLYTNVYLGRLNSSTGTYTEYRIYGLVTADSVYNYLVNVVDVYQKSDRFSPTNYIGDGGMLVVVGAVNVKPSLLPYPVDVNDPATNNLVYFGSNTSNGVYMSVGEFFSGQPVWKGETSTTGGGDGVFEMESDQIIEPPRPPSVALNSGFVSAYHIETLTQLQNLCDFLWGNTDDILTVLGKMFSNPMDSIIGISIIPVPTNDDIEALPIYIGGLRTTAVAKKILTQYVKVDMGTLTVPKYYGNAIDYSPYTQLSIYLPFIGVEPLDIDRVAGKALHLVYHVDILTGSLCAMILIDDSVAYQFGGNCLSSVPISARDMSGLLQSLLSVGGSIGATVASGGALAPVAIPAAASTVASMKPNITKQTPSNSTVGFLGVRSAYLTYTFPRQSLPQKYNTFIGYPSNITSRLGDLEGYTQVEEIHLENIVAETSEKEEIETLLKGGVII